MGSSTRVRLTEGAVEPVAIPLRILLAFAIQAGWDDHQEAAEEVRLLTAVLKEMWEKPVAVAPTIPAFYRFTCL